MSNKGMIIVCIVAIVALVGWLAALAGRETIEDLTKEIEFLKTENARLEKAVKEEPTAAEALASISAKCERNLKEECRLCGTAMKIFCSFLYYKPAGISCYMPGAVQDEIERKKEEYMEANK